MRKNPVIAVVLLGGLLGAGLTACEKKGPAERAGEQIDEAAKDAKEGVKDAAEEVKDAAEEVKDKVVN